MQTIMDTFNSVRNAIAKSSGLCSLIGNADPSLEIYGSTVNSLATNNDSDLDLTLLVKDFNLNHEIIVQVVRGELSKTGRFDVSSNPIQIQSGVLLSVRDQLNQIDVDITINKTLEILNSHLVNTYSAFDIRFVKLALLIKTWNKARFPDKFKRLNSFSLYLMLIAFLQDKGILPNLQALAPEQEPTIY